MAYTKNESNKEVPQPPTGSPAENAKTRGEYDIGAAEKALKQRALDTVVDEIKKLDKSTKEGRQMIALRNLIAIHYPKESMKKVLDRFRNQFRDPSMHEKVENLMTSIVLRDAAFQMVKTKREARAVATRPSPK